MHITVGMGVSKKSYLTLLIGYPFPHHHNVCAIGSFMTVLALLCVFQSCPLHHSLPYPWHGVPCAQLHAADKAGHPHFVTGLAVRC